MADKTGIEWTDATWNPIAGCSVVSPGCKRCYAMRMAARIEAMDAKLGHAPHYRGLTTKTKAGAVWTGKVAAAPSSILVQPLNWKRPRRIFVNSMSDLFHEGVADETIDRVFAIMALCSQHTFQVLTKRAARMRAYLNDPSFGVRVGGQLMKSARGNAGAESVVISLAHQLSAQGKTLDNVWLGVSVEDVERKSRINDLRRTRAAVRFLSCEPLLEDLGEIDLDGIGWVIAGGESGPGARPMHPDWTRSIRDQCQAAGVPLHFKQWGEWLPGENYLETRPAGPAKWQDGETGQHSTCRGREDDGGPEWRHSSQAGQPGAFWLRVGKKRAGAMLDGREWREFPTSAGSR